MIKNGLAVVMVAALGAGCRRADITEGRYQGMIEYDQRDLSFEQPGRVVELAVVRGQEVTAGQVIARQDDSVDRAARDVDARAVAVAQADLALVKAGSRAEDVHAAEAQLSASRAAEKDAQIELDREKKLVDKGALPAAGLDSLTARLASATGERQANEQRLVALRKGSRPEDIARAQSRVDQAQQAIALDDARIAKRQLAVTTDGVVQDVFTLAGEMAGAGVPIVSVVDTRHPYADVFVPVPDAPRVKLHDPAVLRVEGLDAEVKGQVELIYPDAEFTPKFVFSPRERPNLMIRVRVRLDDPQGRLHAGIPAYVTFPGAGVGAGSGGAK
jgi:HlyD family secretion protein